MVLLFGLTFATMLFTKLLTLVWLRQLGITLIGHLDDLLLQTLMDNLVITMHTLLEFGRVWNFKNTF